MEELSFEPKIEHNTNRWRREI